MEDFSESQKVSKYIKEYSDRLKHEQQARTTKVWISEADYNAKKRKHCAEAESLLTEVADLKEDNNFSEIETKARIVRHKQQQNLEKKQKIFFLG